MSQNKLKAKTLSNISRLQGELEGTAKGIETWDKDDFETMKTKLINQLNKLSELSEKVKEDILDVMMLK